MRFLLLLFLGCCPLAFGEQAGVIDLSQGNVRWPAGGGPWTANLSLMGKASSGVTRIFYGGTSIENSGYSPGYHLFEALKRVYGDSGNITVYTPSLSGSTNGALEGWKKQRYGGLAFYRLRGGPGSSPLSWSANVREFVLHYSTEADGGSFAVRIDGRPYATVNCHGGQSYNHKLDVAFPALGFHTITLAPPDSGFGYFETLDENQNNPGIQVLDGSLGGSSINQMCAYPGPGKGEDPAAPPTMLFRGVDSYMLDQSPQGKCDIVIFAWVVNDAGCGAESFSRYYRPALDRIVRATKAHGQQLVLVVEMGGLYGANFNRTYGSIANLLRSYAAQPHVTVIDWNAATHPPATAARAAWQAWVTQYYGDRVRNNLVTLTGEYPNFSAAPNPGGGNDCIHPNPEGMAVGYAQLAKAFNVPSEGRISDPNDTSRLRILARDPALPGFGSPPTAPHPVGARLTAIDNSGWPDDSLLCLGQSFSLAPAASGIIAGIFTLPASLWSSQRQINLFPALNSAIASAGTADDFGPYILRPSSAPGVYYPNPRPTLAGKRVTWTFVVGSGGGVDICDGGNTHLLQSFYMGTNLGRIRCAWNSHANRPIVVHVTTEWEGSQPRLVASGKIYAAYCTPTDFPCIPQAGADSPQLGAPLWMSADIPAAAVLLGQTYYENAIDLNGTPIVVVKQCAGNRVRKIDGGYYGIYRLSDPAKVYPLALEGHPTVSATYDARLGGYPLSSSGNPALAASRMFVPVDGQKLTLCGKVSSGDGDRIAYIGFTGPSGDRYWNEAAQSWQAAPVSYPANAYETVAVTVTMSAALGPGRIRVAWLAPGQGASAFTLVPGSSAGI